MEANKSSFRHDEFSLLNFPEESNIVQTNETFSYASQVLKVDKEYMSSEDYGQDSQPFHDFDKSESEIFFQPWVGDYYADNEHNVFGRKIMVVGASHYCKRLHAECNVCGESYYDGEFCRDYTKHCIEKGYLTHEWKRNRTYSDFVQFFYSRKASRAEQAALIRSIIFYEYLQQCEGQTAHESHPELFAEDRHLNAFKEMLSFYVPDVVLFWGRHAWNQLPKNLDYGDYEADGPDQRNYPFEGKNIVFCALRHPAWSSQNNGREAAFRTLSALGLSLN